MMYILSRSENILSRPILLLRVRTGAGRRFPGIVLTGLLAVSLLLAAAPSDAQPAVRQVLVLQSFDRGNVAVDQFTSNFRVELDQRAEGPVNVVQVVVGPTGFVGAPEQAVVDYIRSTFVDRPKPDLIVTVAGPAAVFARKYRQQLFPDTPTLFASVDQKYLGDVPLGDNETAVAAVNDYPRVIEDILQLLPQTKQVFMVMGSGQVGQFWRRELENEFRRFHDRLTFVWFDNLSVPEALRRSASLPDNSAIVYVIFGTDVAGAAYADERVFAELHAAANAPLFAGAERVPWSRSRRRITAVHRRPQSRHGRRGRSTLERRAAEQRQSAAKAPWATDLRLARVAAMGHPREPVAARQRRALSRSEPVERIQRHGAERRRRAGRPIAPHRRAPVPAPRTPACREDSRRNLALAADASRRQTMSALTSSIAT